MKKLFWALFLTGLMVGGIKLCAAYFCPVKQYICLIDSFLSDECRSSIEQTVAESANRKAGSHEIIHVLQKKFPVIKKVVISYSPHESRVVVSVHRPMAVINESFVFTCHNHIFSKADFSPSALSHIPAVHIDQESMPVASHLLSVVFAQLPVNFYGTHDLVICSKHCIKLIDKMQSQFAISFTVDQSISSALLLQCEQIKKNMMESGYFDKNSAWVADIRFADYVIAYRT